MLKLAGKELVAVTHTLSPERIPVAPMQLTIAVVVAAMVTLATPQTPETAPSSAVPLPPITNCEVLAIVDADNIVVDAFPKVFNPAVEVNVPPTVTLPAEFTVVVAVP